MKKDTNTMGMSRTLCLFVLFMCLKALVGSAQTLGWIDVTDDYINNPRYDNNYLGGWEGTSLSAYNQKENAEHYNKTYNTYQRLSGLTPGSYRLSLSAFYRMGDSGNDYSWYSNGTYVNYQYAELYAISSEGDYSTPIAPASSAALPYSLGGGISYVGNGYYIPNNMEAAYYWFEEGYYKNVVECEVGEDGELMIGIRKSYGINNDWTCIDNWQLEYFGEMINATEVVLSDEVLDLVVGESRTLTATVLPENATYHKVTWWSDDESVATVDDQGVVRAVSEGTAVIMAETIDDSGVDAICEVTVSTNDPTAANVIINEIMASNIDVYLDPSWNYGSWVELYNPTGKGVSLGGLYVTDDPANLKKYRLIDGYGAIPPGGFALLNFDHFEVFKWESYRQIDGSLNPEGGMIIISDGERIIAQQTYPQAIGRTSWARTTDGGATWGTTAEPTPERSNASSTFATTQLSAPVISQPAQLFTGTLQVNVTIPTGATLVYTTDGSTPTMTNGKISATGSFRVTGTTCYRFRLFKTGMLPSPVVTRTYIYNNGNEPFPIISVVTDNANLYGADYGVFSQSENGRAGNGQSSPCNWNMPWDRPVNFEYITTDNECVVSQECDFSMCGGWSRAWTPHSFKLKANKIYDLQNSLDYQFFENKPFLRHKTLQIRNGGNDTSCRIKDGSIQGVVEASGIYVDYQSWKPVHIYINGQAYAVLNMREPNNKHFAKANYGYDSEELDQFEIGPDSGYVQMTGTDESFQLWYDLAEDAANEASYADICKLVDIDEYINYMAIELYLGNNDWPRNNVKGFRSKADGKFHFVLFDLDHSFNTSNSFNEFADKQTHTFNALYGYNYATDESIEGKQLTLEIKFVTIFLNMLKNPTFKKKFVDAFCLVAGSVFTPELTNQIISERANLLATGGHVNPYNTSNSLINSFASRQNTMINAMQNYLKLSTTGKITASLSSNISEAQILLNGMEVPTGSFSGTLYTPVTVKAMAPAGYKFLGWSDSEPTVTSTTNLFADNTTWYYYDKGSLDGKSWKASNYSTTDWKSGSAPLGYGQTVTTTTNTSLSTLYFRKNVNVRNYSATNGYVLEWVADDGFIIYVNGVEAGRYNMPSGEVRYSTYSTTWAHDNPDSGTMQLDASLFRSGTNVIAVELHNNSGTSSDLYWRATLKMKTYAESSGIVSTDVEYTLPTSGSPTLRAVWEKVSDADLIAAGSTPVKVNEISAANTVYVNEYFKKDDWVELYNTTDAPIDVAGMYLSDDLDNPQKYQIPATDEVNTVIEPKSHLVVWASKRIGSSQLHAPFKLGNEDAEKVILTDEEGKWADTLIYVAHTGTQSVGLYPDGGQSVYLMEAPTIGKQNLYTPYAELIGMKPYNMAAPGSRFTLELAEGWNWVSHPLANDILVSTLTTNAENFLSQTKQYINDPRLGWVGGLTSLTPAAGYKVKMKADMDYTYGAPFFDVAANAVTLKAGWNWIGYPQLFAQPVSAAFADAQPEEGDIIVGQTGIATYEGGAWDGTLNTLQPGEAYLYKSAKTKAFHYAEASGNTGNHAKARFLSQPRSPWTTQVGAYPNVMNIIATVNEQGEQTTDYAVGAFTEAGECRGVGKYIGNTLYLTVYGGNLENIFLKAAHPQTGIVSNINETFFFNGEVLGSRLNPVSLTLGEATDIAAVKYASALESVNYYTLDGRPAGTSKAGLTPGIYLVKYRLTDGRTLTKKIRVEFKN